jgi:hypothetical protein
MKNNHIKYKVFSICLVFILQAGALLAQSVEYPPVNKVRADFKALLERPRVDPDPSFQTISNTDSVIIEKGTIYSEKNEKIPILIYKPVIAGQKSFPVVIFLHGTGGSKDDKGNQNIFRHFNKMGIMTVAIDARYHGERIPGGAHGAKEYNQAVYNAWKNTEPATQQHPFLYDTSFDLWRLTDYLITRPDVQANRIGMTGVSMGGIETWMAASVDKRIKVVVLDIAAQSFKWSLENNRWQGRAGTIGDAHKKVARDLGDSTLNARNVKALWDKILPGITGEFDCPSMIRLIAPRPLLVLSTENDQNCPLPGALIAFNSAKAVYSSANALDKLKMDVAANQPHRLTPEHLKMLYEWFGKWL